MQDPTAPATDKKGSKRVAPEEQNLSFFCWFGEDEDDELADEIKENFWPNLVAYYHNVRTPLLLLQPQCHANARMS